MNRIMEFPFRLILAFCHSLRVLVSNSPCLFLAGASPRLAFSHTQVNAPKDISFTPWNKSDTEPFPTNAVTMFPDATDDSLAREEVQDQVAFLE